MNVERAFRAAALGLSLAVGLAPPALAWKLKPEATSTERGLTDAEADLVQAAIIMAAGGGVAILGDAVHEQITRAALQCPNTEDRDQRWSPGCEIDIRDQLVGVHWNDDPAFKFLSGRGDYVGCKPGRTVRMNTQPVCWGRVFSHGEKAAARGVRLTGRNGNLLVRSHFGDLQFLHAMAVSEGETPQETQRNVMAWMEFTWRTAIGDKGFDSQRVVSMLPVDGFAERFKYNRGWRIQDLFALDNPGVREPESIQKIAFGSLLHVVEDSFAAGHVDRAAPVPGATCPGTGWPAPGPINEFHSYPKQDSHKHGSADGPKALDKHLKSTRPNVIDVVGTLGILWRSRTPWLDARPYLECVFALSAEPRTSTAGNGFERTSEPSPSQAGG